MSTCWNGFSMTETREHLRLKTLRAVIVASTLCVALTGALVAGSITSAKAQDSDDSVFTSPILDKQNGSYFELVPFPGDGKGTWDEAKALAEARAYEGRKGRLAVIKNQSTNRFILQNLASKEPQDEIWFGLTYHCDSRQLIWEDGTIVKPTDFVNWDNQWYWDYAITCEYSGNGLPDGKPYMTVFLKAAQNGFTWQASGANKVFNYLLVEYPAPKGHKNKNASDAATKEKETTASAK